jgi:hypothetical protein
MKKEMKKSLRPLIESIIHESSPELKIEKPNKILSNLKPEIDDIINDESRMSIIMNRIANLLRDESEVDYNIFKVGMGGHHIWISNMKNERQGIIVFDGGFTR